MARVLVVGAGAVGGYYGACLARAGHDVVFVARGANLEALRRDGLSVTGAMGDFSVGAEDATDVPESTGRFDLVLLCVKSYDLEEVVGGLSGVDGVAVTMQNGVDAPDVARAALGDRVLAGSTGIVADLPEPGHVHVVSAYAWIRFGEPDGSGLSERVETVRSILAVEGIEPIPAKDARVALWEKMALMCGMAGLTTLHQRPIGEILGDPNLRATFGSIVEECETVARGKDVPLVGDFATKRLMYADQIDPSAMSSMSRDFARGRRIELETFNGAVVRMGAELGVDVPANRATYEAIKERLS